VQFTASFFFLVRMLKFSIMVPVQQHFCCKNSLIFLFFLYLISISCSTAAPQASFLLTEAGMETNGLTIYAPGKKIFQTQLEELIQIEGEYGLKIYSRTQNRIREIIVQKPDIKGAARITMRVFLTGPPAADYYRINYSSSYYSGSETPAMVSLINAPVGKWFDLIFFLPDFFPERPDFGIKLVQTEDENHREERIKRGNLRSWRNSLWLGEEESIVISKLKIEKSLIPTSEKAVLEKLQKESDQQSGYPEKQKLLLISFSVMCIIIIFGFRFSIGLKIFSCLGTIFILTVSFLFFYCPAEHEEFLESLLYEQKSELESIQGKIIDEGYRIEEDFAHELEVMLADTRAFLESARKNGENFRENLDFTNFMALSEEERRLKSNGNHSKDKLEQFLFQQFEKLNIDFIFTNGSSSWFARRIRYNLEFRYHARFFHQILSAEIRSDVTANQAKDPGIIGKLFTELRNILTFGMQNSRLVDDFLNNPGRLSDLGREGLISRGEAGRTFWTAFVEEEQDEVWFIIGIVQKKKLISALQNKIDKLIKKENLNRTNAGKEPVNFFFAGISDWISFPEENQNKTAFAQIAAATYEAQDKVFAHLPGELGSDMYISENFAPLNDYTLVLHSNTDHIIKKLNQRKNRDFIFAVTVTLLLLFISFLFTAHILKPLKKLIHGFEKMRHFDSEPSITVQGQDQFAELLHQFNDVSAFLKQKKLFFNFLTESLLLSAQEKNHSPFTENIMLFCLQLNNEHLNDFSDNEMINSIHETGCLFSDCLSWHQGFTEDFENNTFFAFFREKVPAENPVKFLYDFRLLYKEINKKRLSENLKTFSVNLSICCENTTLYLFDDGTGSILKSFRGARNLAMKMNNGLHRKTADGISVIIEEKALSRMVSVSNTKYKQIEGTELEIKEKRLFYEIL
jgi:hypothetical protein